MLAVPVLELFGAYIRLINLLTCFVLENDKTIISLLTIVLQLFHLPYAQDLHE